MPAYKDAARNTWFVKFRYTDWQGIRKETTRRGFATKRDAKAFEEEFKRKISGSSNMTFECLYDIYLDDRKKNTKQSTISSIEYTAHNHLLDSLGKIPLSDITPNVIRKWQNKLATKGLSPSTMKQINRRLYAILNFAVKYYGVSNNPMSVTGTQGHYEKRIDYWSKEDFDTFYAALKRPIDKTLFLTLYYTGMRIGEALALTFADFDYDNASLTINKTMNHETHIITQPKTLASNRVCSIPTLVRDSIKNLKDKLPYDDGAIFPISYKVVYDHYKLAIKKSGVKSLPIHSLRHAHVSQLIAMGIPITAISKRIGHSSPQITLSVYAHAESDSDEKIAQMLENI